MNKQEALQKIKELQEYIEECDRKPALKIGQLYARHGNTVYMVTHGLTNLISYDDFNLSSITDGNSWKTNRGFDGDDDSFEYVGMIGDLKHS